MLKGLRQYFDPFYQQWLVRRLPPGREIHLDRKCVFVFPSAAGAAFALLLTLLWLVATNYENNLVFGFAFLLTALGIVGILHSVANIAGVTVTAVRARPAFAGDFAEFEIALRQSTPRHRDGIRLAFPNGPPMITTFAQVDAMTLQLSARAPRRGWFAPGRLTLESVYPLGLFRVWTHLDLDLHALVYPQPVPTLPVTASSGRGEGAAAADGGSEDFRGLEKFRVGESLRHVAWKQYAREQGLHTKRYADPLDERLWLDWNTFAGMDREARLSRLCGALLAVSATRHRYGLRLPGVEIAPDRGDAHRDQILRVLALYELPSEPSFGHPPASRESISSESMSREPMSREPTLPERPVRGPAVDGH